MCNDKNLGRKAERLRYFDNAHYEGDQESFLMWVFYRGFCAKEGDAVASLAKELIALCFNKTGSHFDWKGIEITPRPKRQVSLEKGTIDIVVFFSVGPLNYVLGIEHKLNAKLQNPLKEYLTGLTSLYKEACAVRLCVLKPYGFSDDEREWAKKSGAQVVEQEFIKLVARYAEKDSFVADFIYSYYPGIVNSAPLQGLSGKLRMASLYMFTDIDFCGYCCSIDEHYGCKALAFVKGAQRVTFRILNWETGEFCLHFDAKTISLLDQQEFFYKKKSEPIEKTCFYLKNEPRLKTVKDFKDALAHVLNVMSKFAV